MCIYQKDVHYYSVPYRYVSKKVKVVYTDSFVEIFYNNLRIASQIRDRKKEDTLQLMST